MPEAMSLLPAALRIAASRDMRIPDDLDHFGMRACHSDFTSSYGYRWPFPGQWAEASGPFLDHAGGCPAAQGDGICVATTWAGMASGGIPAVLVLLVGWCKEDVLGESTGKARVRRAFVVDAVTPLALLAERTEDEGADLCGANLCGADLYGANLRGANLRGANLRGADLYGANLREADLYVANLREADLYVANLRGANLRGANLRGADLRGANLRGANLRGADLYGADLRGANLRGADLYGADLRGADLYGALNREHAYGIPKEIA